jgi:hypothetical protein
MPAVVVDSSVLISLAAGEQFQLFRDFFSTILELLKRRTTFWLAKDIYEAAPKQAGETELATE